MPKVFLFINSLQSGGAERVSVSLCNYLVSQGYSVSLITLYFSDVDFYIPDAKVKRLYLEPQKRRSAGTLKILNNSNRVRILRRIIKQDKPEVLIGFMTSSSVLSIAASFGLPVQTIVSERNNLLQKKASFPWNILRRIFYRFANAHVVQTVGIEKWLKQYTQAKNIHVIPNSLTWPIPKASAVDIAPHAVFPEPHNIILAVGSKTEQKGFDLLLKAFSHCASTYSEWSLVIIGVQAQEHCETNAREQLNKLAWQAGIQAQFHCLEPVGNISDWYQCADIFVLSSRYEGFPNVLIEAMGSGCASVAFDCETGPREIIQNEVNGLLVPPEDIVALTQAMERLMSDSSLRHYLGSNAKEVRKRYSEEKIFGQWVSLIDDLVSIDQ